MMKEDDAVIISEIQNEYFGSDHCPISLTIDLDKIKPIKNITEEEVK